MPPGKPPKLHKSENRSRGPKKIRSVEDVVEYARVVAWRQTEKLWSLHISKSYSRFILLLEVVLCIFIIQSIKYTEIDWTAYMEEVEGFLNGTLDYAKLEGGTGPLVYPAGFVYLYSLLYYLTDKGRDIRTAQYIFAGIYLGLVFLVFRLYRRSQRMPAYILFLICFLAKRIHSIFVLRMFNDGVAMLFLYGSANLFIDNHWLWGCLAFSSAVSIKMNILLFAPGLLFLLLRQGYRTTVLGLCICALWQFVLALPFLLVSPVAYIERSFDLRRQFFFEWTVNWRFIGEEMFRNLMFQTALLVVHVCLLVLLLTRIWLPLRRSVTKSDSAGVNAKLLILFSSNFVGVVCSRSLHYQFYVWYFHTLHFILWSLPMRNIVRFLLLGAIEMSWNTFPSTILSSIVLLMAHVVIIISLLRLPGSTMVKPTEPSSEPTASKFAQTSKASVS